MDENVGVDITPDSSEVPVFLVPQTGEQVAEVEQWAVEAVEAEAATIEALAAADAVRESAHTKLADLGLTPEEIAAIITP